MNRIKYPRTLHLPWSMGITSDDKVLKDLSCFNNKKIVVTEKRDGENFTVYSDGYCHMRSLDCTHHNSRNWLLREISNFSYKIPKGWRVCGEYLYATHSIYYPKLKSFLEVFSVWNEKNVCLSWKDTKAFCKELNLFVVPVIDVMVFNETKLKTLADNIDINNQEGYVIRLFSSFTFDSFGFSVAKWVRPNHVKSNTHWKDNKYLINKIVTEQSIGL